MPRLPVVNVKGRQTGFCEGDPKEAGAPRSFDRAGRTIPIDQEERCKRAPLPGTQPADSAEDRANV